MGKRTPQRFFHSIKEFILFSCERVLQTTKGVDAKFPNSVTMKTSSFQSALATEVSPRVRGLFLKNLGDFQTELARIVAGFVPGMMIWRQRKELPGLIFRSLRRVQDLRQRGRELGVSFEEMHFRSVTVGRSALEALCHAGSSADLLQAALVDLPDVMMSAIGDYLKRNEGVYDLPSVALLEANRDELMAQRRWAEFALTELKQQAALSPAPVFINDIKKFSADLAQAFCEHNVRGLEMTRAARNIGALPLRDAVLPLGFRHLEFGPEPLSANSVYAERERYHAVNFLQEVQATDSCASMLFEAPDMPWDFFFDLSRHMWDESRHAMFGERKLLELGSSAAEAGLSTKAYCMRQTLTPLDRYAALTTQEADAFPGKHVGLKDAVANNDTLSAMAWSYDIADETQHLRFGTKWIPVMREKMDDPRSVEQIKDDACNWRVSVLAEVYKPAAASFR